jgi:hypothetical protein
VSAYPGTMPLRRPPQPYPLRPYRPDGEVSPPFVLIEGPEKSGKTWAVAEATADPRICHTWWIEWGEKPVAKEYGKIPGADYEIVPHDGTIWAVLSLVEQLSVRAREMVGPGKAPMIVIDSMAGEWENLKKLAHLRTMETPSVKRKIANDPAAAAESHPIATNTWNDVTDLHYELLRMLQDWPGIAVMISRGKEVTAFDESGKPVTGTKTYKVEGQKNLGYDASAWVRFSRDTTPLVVGCRSVCAPLKPGVDRPRDYKGLPWLVFQVLQFEPKPWQPPTAPPAPAATPAGPTPAPMDWEREFETAAAITDPGERRAAFEELWTAAKFHTSRFGLSSMPEGFAERIKTAGQAARDEQEERDRALADELGADLADIPEEARQ